MPESLFVDVMEIWYSNIFSFYLDIALYTILARYWKKKTKKSKTRFYTTITYPQYLIIVFQFEGKVEFEQKTPFLLIYLGQGVFKCCVQEVVICM